MYETERSSKVKMRKYKWMKLLKAIRAIASLVLGLNTSRKNTPAVNNEADPLTKGQNTKHAIEENVKPERPEHSSLVNKEDLIPAVQESSHKIIEKTWQEASSELKASKRPGRVVNKGDGFDVEYHDHWRDEYAEKEKARKKEILLQKQISIRQEEERREKARLNKIRIQKEKEDQEKARIKEEEERKIIAQKQYDDRIRREKRNAEKRAAWELRKRKDQKEKKQSRVRELVGQNATILAQYRHPGSSSDQFSEWGAWVIIENNNYSIYHESEDRVTYGNREKIVEVGTRKEAINYCNYLVGKGWYRDTMLFDVDPSTKDFPQPAIPTDKERNQARLRFKRWKDIAAQEDEIT